MCRSNPEMQGGRGTRVARSLRPGDKDDVRPLVARTLRSESGRRAHHQPDGFTRLWLTAVERCFLDLCTDIVGRDLLLGLTWAESFIGRRMPLAVNIGKDPGVAFDDRPAGCNGGPLTCLGVLDPDRRRTDRDLGDGGCLGPAADVRVKPVDRTHVDLVG